MQPDYQVNQICTSVHLTQQTVVALHSRLKDRGSGNEEEEEGEEAAAAAAEETQEIASIMNLLSG